MDVFDSETVSIFDSHQADLHGETLFIEIKIDVDRFYQSIIGGQQKIKIKSRRSRRYAADSVASSGLNNAPHVLEMILKAAIIKLCRVNPILPSPTALLPLPYSPSCRAFLIKKPPLLVLLSPLSPPRHTGSTHRSGALPQRLPREYVFLKLYPAFHAYVIVMFNKMGDIAVLECGVGWAREGEGEGGGGSNGCGTARPLQFLEKYRPRLA